ncbi:MAG: SbcC/MukB-like Walker B domain-containing protein, partial [Eubacteriales bacterium]|nr:SbcC/MukB-like Walker B domain-containing protein [Eubacteriales bacterium]
NHAGVYEAVLAAKQRLARTDGAYERLRKLADLASGRAGDDVVWSFDKFAMTEFFCEILEAANEHLAVMSGGKYSLVHQVKGERKNSAAGLNIEIRDAFTGEQRKTASLSGGESFQVSMALALGLSGTVQAHAGGQRVDAMFIDEGFGSLDERVLENAVQVLDRLAGDTRQIGVISHVAKLEECIPQKIVVRSGKSGSSLRIVR